MDIVPGHRFADSDIFCGKFFCGRSFQYTHNQKTKIIDMLSAEKENEPELKKSRFIPVVVILFLMFTLWELFSGIQNVRFYYDSRFVFPVKIMYWGNILLPVVTLGWAALWMLKKKKIAFQKLIDGLLICSVLHAFLVSKRTCSYQSILFAFTWWNTESISGICID